MFKEFILALFKRGRGFTPLEIQESQFLFKNSKAKPPNGSALSVTRISDKFLTGFTVVELMVVTGIIITISAVVLVGYRSGNQQLALSRSAHKLAQDIRRAQEMAMSSAKVGGSVPAGIGIFLHRDFGGEGGIRYRMYADDGNEIFDGGDSIISAIDLEKGVYIKEIRREVGLVPNPDCHWGSINFRPPDPAVNIFLCVSSVEPCPGLNFPGESWMRITLALEEDPSQTKTVRVNNVGLIYVE